MYVQALVLLIMGTVLQAIDIPGKPYCPLSRWQAVRIDVKSRSTSRFITHRAFDAAKKVGGTATYLIGGDTPIFRTFTDYQNLIFSRVNMSGDPSTYTCQKSLIPDEDPFDECYGRATRDLNAERLGNTTFGPAVNGIPYTGWFIKYRKLNITIALAKEGRIPLVERVVGTMSDGTVVDSFFVYNQVTPDITDQTLITMPDICAGATTPAFG